MPLTYYVGRPPLRPAAGKGEFRSIYSAVLLRLKLIATALIVLLNRTKLIDGTVAAHVNGELLQVTVAAFGVRTNSSPFCLMLYCCQSLDWLRAMSINGVLLVASFSGGGRLLNKRVVEP